MNPNTGSKMAAATLFAAGLLGLGTSGAGAAGVPDRPADPLVLTGAQTPNLIGTAPGDVVAFRWDGTWRQVPVQVDERKMVDMRVVRQLSLANPEFRSEVYADPGTFAGADGISQEYWTGAEAGQPIPGTAGDPDFDANDEIAMMAMDAGDSAVGKTAPAGVDAGSRTPVRVSDPLNPGKFQYLYLFRTTTGLEPGAGRDYVAYSVVYEPALAGGYFDGYNFNSIGDNNNGPPVNPEASKVSTNLYEQTFPGRWMIDGLKIRAGDATEADILDGDKSMIGQSSCGRNELTFSRGGGGVIAAIDGPVRAIRSYLGANSGTYTQRDQIYYQGLMVNNTYLRVHQGISDFVMALDYNENAFGMTYRNPLVESGVTIDGVPESPAVPTGQIDWEQVTGDQGTVTSMTRVDTDVPGTTFSSYYQDNMSPPDDNDAILCSGDDHAIGASGPRARMPGAGLNTDPTLPPSAPSTEVNNFTGHRFTYYSSPNEPLSTAKLRSQQVDSPLGLATGDGVDGERPDGPPDPDPPDPTKPGRQNWVGLKVSVKPANARLRVGSARKVRVKVRNIGDQTGRRVKVCPVAKASLVKTSDCRVVKKLKAGRAAKLGFRVRLRGGSAGLKKVKVRFRAKASRSKARSGLLVLRPSGI